jgi:hypothetical protein
VSTEEKRELWDKAVALLNENASRASLGVVKAPAQGGIIGNDDT